MTHYISNEYRLDGDETVLCGSLKVWQAEARGDRVTDDPEKVSCPACRAIIGDELMHAQIAP